MVMACLKQWVLRGAIALTVFGSPMAWAQESGDGSGADSIDPAAWASSLLEAGEMKGVFPRKILVVSDVGTKGVPRVVDIDRDALANNSFVTAVSADEMRWGFLLNAGMDGKRGHMEGKSETTRIVMMSRMTGADLVLVCPPKAPDCQMYAVSEAGTRRTRVPTIGDPRDGDGVRRWLRKVFGYDAVVMARKGSYALTGGFDAFKGDSLQALALAGSETRYIMADKARRGLAVLDLVRHAGPWAVFRVVLADKAAPSEGVPVGVKLLVQAGE